MENGKMRYKHKCVKTTNWDDHRSIERWRYNIEYRVNQAYQAAGIDARVSAASYQTLGIDRVPTKHIVSRHKPQCKACGNSPSVFQPYRNGARNAVVLWA